MRAVFILAATVALAGCQKTVMAENNMTTDNMAMGNAMAANDMMATNEMNANAMATPAAMTSVQETTWEFTDPKTKKPIQESIDATGKYIAVSGKEHIDHGMAEMKDGKLCFTSAMAENKAGDGCWTNPMLAVGRSGETTSDKGEKLTVKRVAYVPLTM